jgi:hypothetical protein
MRICRVTVSWAVRANAIGLAKKTTRLQHGDSEREQLRGLLALSGPLTI